MKKKNIYNRPGLHSDSSDKDVAAIGLVSTILASNGGVASDLNHHDTWPNTDGQLELKTASGEPDGLLAAQVKPIKVGKNTISHTFEDDKFICYCKEERGLPIIFIGVDLTKRKAYWIEMSPEYARGLKALTIRIPSENIIDYGNTNYLIPWKAICDRRKKALAAAGRGFDSPFTDGINSQKSAIVQLFETPSQSELLNKNIEAVNSIVNNIREKILLYEGHLFLVSPTYINNISVRETIRKNIDITIQQEELFVDELLNKGILSKTGDVVVFADDALGQEKVTYLARNNLINIEKTYDSFPDIKVRKAILKKIVGIAEVEQIEEFFKSLVNNLLEHYSELVSNDDVIANLELLGEYSFRVPKEAVRVVDSVIQSNPLPVKKYKDKIFGEYPGATNERLLLESIEVLNTIRYLEIKSVFEIAVRLGRSEMTEVRKKALELINHISEYNIFALRKVGYYPQQQILSILKEWDVKKLKENSSVLLEVTKEILNSEFEGSEMTDWRTFTLSFGPLAASKELESIRDGLAKIVKSFYLQTNDIQIKKKLLDVLEVGTRTPNRGKYTDELEELILKYVNELMIFFIEIVHDENLVLIHEMEEQLHWFIRRFKREKIPLIGKLEKELEANDLYQLFRVFYGYDLDFDEKLPWREAKERRESIIDGFIEKITVKTFNKWKSDICIIAKTFNDEYYDKFQYFNTFLNRLAKQKPIFAFKLLDESNTLEPFLPQIVLGLWESELQQEVRNELLIWAKNGKRLSIIAGIFWYTKKIDIELLTHTFKSAISNKDIPALTMIVKSLVFSYQGESAIKTLFIEVIKELTTLGNVRWVFNFYPPESTLIEDLNDKEVDLLLENLLLVEDVGHDVEEILSPIAKNFPSKVIKYFEMRIEKKISRTQSDRYDAIPFRLYELPKTIEDQADVVLDEVFKWFRKPGIYLYYGGQFIKEIYPSLNLPLKNRLLALIKEGGEHNADIVLTILRAYEGQLFLHEVAKAFIKKYLRSEKNKSYEEYRGELFIALSTTGVVSGEYGLPEAYKQKKEAIQSWKSDKSKSLQRFIRAYEDYLEKNIAYHTKRADEDIELMKRGRS